MKKIETILDRPVHDDLRTITTYHRVLVLGGKGSIGQALIQRLPNCIVTDIEEIDVRFPFTINEAQYGKIDVVINLAGAKHAPEGELKPHETTLINTIGAFNAINAAKLAGAHYIQASTCKAANPETVYGASKLIAERMTLQSGFTVARFFNVVETSGNVFEIWDSQAQKIIMEGNRYFISIDEAVGLLIACCSFKAGRYAVNPGKIHKMMDVFNRLYVGLSALIKPLRKGDRVTELIHSTSESIQPITDSIIQIKSAHD